MLPNVYVNSFPKGGTHLTVRLLELLGLRRHFSIDSSLLWGKKRLAKLFLRGTWLSSDSILIGVDFLTPIRASWLSHKLSQTPVGGVVFGHVVYSDHFFHLLETRDFKCIQVIRDPRDIAVSHAHYVSTSPSHFLYPHYQKLGDWSTRLAFSITGGPVKGAGYLGSIANRARSLDGWMRKSDVLTVRFEDLVGTRGGGSDEIQREVIVKICAFLGFDCSLEQIKEVQNELFGGSRTFRKGQIGSWEKEFGVEHILLFAEIAGDVLSDWGYASE